MRPMRDDIEAGQQPCLEIDGQTVSVIPNVIDDSPDDDPGPWKFDLAMDSSLAAGELAITNAKCYDLMGQRMVEQALSGYNTCLFCYGQTGTGKSTTIFGDEIRGPGLLVQLLKDLFQESDRCKAAGASMTFKCQYLEVYNEKINDLLFAMGPEDAHVSKVVPHVTPTGVTVTGAVTIDVHTYEETIDCIKCGDAHKVTAPTKMNPQSSRGHSVFKLMISKENPEDGTKLSSEMYFADLAGHENEKTTQVKGDRFTELTYINKSLMWLQNAINNMAQEAKAAAKSPRGGGDGATTPRKVDYGKFRNSKLTLLLAGALTGNSKTALITTLSPAAQHFDTSVSSLKFAAQVKGLKLDVSANAQQNPQVIIKKLKDEVKLLRVELMDSKEDNEPQAQDDSELVEELRQEIAEAHNDLEEACDVEDLLRDELREAQHKMEESNVAVPPTVSIGATATMRVMATKTMAMRKMSTEKFPLSPAQSMHLKMSSPVKRDPKIAMKLPHWMQLKLSFLGKRTEEKIAARRERRHSHTKYGDVFDVSIPEKLPSWIQALARHKLKVARLKVRNRDRGARLKTVSFSALESEKKVYAPVEIDPTIRVLLPPWLQLVACKRAKQAVARVAKANLGRAQPRSYSVKPPPAEVQRPAARKADISDLLEQMARIERMSSGNQQSLEDFLKALPPMTPQANGAVTNGTATHK